MPPLPIPTLVIIRHNVAIVGRLSDSLIRFGPFRLGLDGVLSWIPGLGALYSAAAAAFIIVQGVRARVPPPVLLACAALMGGRTLIGAVPLAGPLLADLFLAHWLSARIMVRAIDKMLPEGAALLTAPPEPWWRTAINWSRKPKAGCPPATGCCS
jgi:Domain of unknown function (DUF4112)